jgi:two-component system chemotaxis sensor kinase CheA
VEVGYAIDSVQDIVALPDAYLPSPAPGPILGVTLVEGKPVELLDPYWLFGEADRSAVTADRPICVLRDARDPWMREILRPLIEQAGYRIAAPDEAGAAQAAVTLALAEDDEVAPVVPGHVVRIRATPAPRHAADDSIYRYDRRGLLAALDAAVAIRS